MQKFCEMISSKIAHARAHDECEVRDVLHWQAHQNRMRACFVRPDRMGLFLVSGCGRMRVGVG